MYKEKVFFIRIQNLKIYAMNYCQQQLTKLLEENI